MKLPDGWKKIELQNVIQLFSGQHINKNDYNYCGEGTPYLTGPSDFVKSKIQITRYTNTPKVICNPGDILLTCKGSGTGTAIASDKKYCISRQLMAIRPIKIDNHFLLSVITNEQSRFSKVSAGLIPGISRDDVQLLPIALPPLKEQQRIADVLGTWDEAIEKTEQLIEAKEKELGWVRNNILTGKIRVNKKTLSWKKQRLSTILKEHGLKSTCYEEVYSVSVHKGLVNQVEHLGRVFAAKNTDNYNLVRPGDIVYTKSPTGDFPYGIIKINRNAYDVIVSPLYGVFTPKWPELGIFLECYFESPVNAINYLRPIIQKGAKNTINITNKIFLSNLLYLPTEQEEVRDICALISSTKVEIDILKNKLAALQKQKRGLMQKLLTGTWRV